MDHILRFKPHLRVEPVDSEMVFLVGGAAAQRLGFSDVTPRDPVQLERFAGEVAHALAAQPCPSPSARG